MSSIIERLEKWDFNFSEEADIQYLKSTQIGDVVIRGLTELNRVRPTIPLLFLGNWLMSESRGYEIKRKINEYNDKKEELRKEHEVTMKIKNQEIRNALEAKKTEEQILVDFKNFIRNNSDMETNLPEILEGFKKYTNSTGVYMAVYDKIMKPVTPDDDEFAHIGDTSVLRYLATCKDHEFMKNMILETSSCYTYEVLKEEAQDAENRSMNASITSNPDKFKVPRQIVIPEVVRDPMVKFFREPKLGSFIVIDMTYQSSLNVKCLSTAIDNWKEYDQKLRRKQMRESGSKEELKPEKKEVKKPNKKDEEKEKRQNTEEQPKEDNLENADNLNPEEGGESGEKKEEKEEKQAVKETEEDDINGEITLRDYETFKKQYVLGLDNLGQDREYTPEEKQMIQDLSILIKISWEEQEKVILIRDRDIRIQMMSLEQSYKSNNPPEKLFEEEDKAIKAYFLEQGYDMNNITNEDVKRSQTEYAKSRFIINNLITDNYAKEYIIKYNQTELIDNEVIFQNILYFIGISNLEINQENTNKLCWKNARKYWNSNVLESLKLYDPFGPKTTEVSSFAKINRLIRVFGSIDREKVNGFSSLLNKLLGFMILILNIRKENILRRTAIKKELKIERENLIIKMNKRSDKLKFDLAEAKMIHEQKATEGEVLEPFNEEEYLEKWEKENPETEIPPEIVMDIDLDFDPEQ